MWLSVLFVEGFLNPKPQPLNPKTPKPRASRFWGGPQGLGFLVVGKCGLKRWGVTKLQSFGLGFRVYVGV